MSLTVLQEHSDTWWTAGCRLHNSDRRFIILTSEERKQRVSWVCFCPLQLKYKEDGKKELSTNLYSVLPETEEMKLAKAAMELQSEVGRLQSVITPTIH